MISTLAFRMLQGPVRDTVVAVASRDGLSLAVDISVVVVAVAVVVMSLALARLVVRADRALKEVRGGVRQGLGPVSERARAISDNVEFITHAVRADVEGLSASVKALTERLHQASNRMEERIEEFNALMEVVQGEAEDLFIDAAATVRGVREGARSITRPRPTVGGEALPEGEADMAALLEGEPDPARLTDEGARERSRAPEERAARPAGPADAGVPEPRSTSR
jgi:uncharacterized protein YoxC